MASMTDLIFLLLIFFMITSTMVSPNAIKVLLPQGRQQTSAKPLTRVIIDKNPICMWLFMRMRLCLTAK